MCGYLGGIGSSRKGLRLRWFHYCWHWHLYWYCSCCGCGCDWCLSITTTAIITTSSSITATVILVSSSSSSSITLDIVFIGFQFILSHISHQITSHHIVYSVVYLQVYLPVCLPLRTLPRHRPGPYLIHCIAKPLHHLSSELIR